MRFNLIALSVFVSLILGCGTTSAIKHKGKDLFIHYYTSDSLGVEKSVFAKNEPLYFSCVIKNVSNHPIKYSYTGDPTLFFTVSYVKVDDNEIVRSSNFHPNPITVEKTLCPDNRISLIYKNPRADCLSPGRFYATFFFSIEFEPKYNKAFSRLNRQVYFKIEEE